MLDASFLLLYLHCFWDGRFKGNALNRNYSIMYINKYQWLVLITCNNFPLKEQIQNAADLAITLFSSAFPSLSCSFVLIISNHFHLTKIWQLLVILYILSCLYPQSTVAKLLNFVTPRLIIWVTVVYNLIIISLQDPSVKWAWQKGGKDLNYKMWKELWHKLYLIVGKILSHCFPFCSWPKEDCKRRSV